MAVMDTGYTRPEGGTMATGAEQEVTHRLPVALRIRREANQVDRIGGRLARNLMPGHADYISKAGAATALAAVCLNLHQIVHDIEIGSET